MHVCKSEGQGIAPIYFAIFARFDRFFIAVSLLKISQISDNLSIKFAIVAMNIDNASMRFAFFHFFIANFQFEFNPEYHF